MTDVKVKLNPNWKNASMGEVSNNIRVLTDEILTYKQLVTTSIIEIGKRLKHAKENDLTRGKWTEWLRRIEIESRQAQRFIQAFEQFGDTSASTHLESSKIIEMLTLPPTVDRAEFIAKKHTIPSTGEEKTVGEMSTREIREVVKEERRAAGLVRERTSVKTEKDEPISDSKPTIQQLIAELDRSSISDVDTEVLLQTLLTRDKGSLVDVLARMGFEQAEEFAPITTTEAHSGPRRVLGVSETASFDEIRRKYRGLMKMIHPDKGGSSFLSIAVKDAYEQLEAEHKRKTRYYATA